ncbi:MAG: hypothetical protein QXU74_03690 [Candidatus Aenigmatarchaeota archaeon]
MLKRITFIGSELHEFSENLSKKYGLELFPYPIPHEGVKPEHYSSYERLQPGTLLLGFNYDHHYSGMLSDLPTMIIFDSHTDMCCNIANRPEYNNWVYWLLKKRNVDVHLILPSFIHPDNIEYTLIPDEKKDKIHFYCLRTPRKEFFKTDKGACEKVIENIDELYKSLPKKPLDLSIDFDFEVSAEFNSKESKEIEKLIGEIKGEDVISFWLKGGSSESMLPQLKFCDRLVDILMKH